MSIQIQHITKTFRETRALDDVTLTLDAGHIYGLLGNNGAGKTTLLNIMTNRIYPDRGTVTVDGKSVFGQDETLNSMFLMGKQNLFPNEIRVQRAFSITESFYPHFDRAYALALAQRFKLNLRQKVSSLSTGYASIFRLITALSVNAPYILFDEPVLGLDAGHRDLFYKILIEKCAEASCTVILSTHLIQEVADIVEHVVIIHNGRILRNQSCESLLADSHRVTGSAELVDAYAKDRRVLSSSTIGGLKTVSLQGQATPLPDGLEVDRMNLQEYFIELTRGEDAQ